MKPKRPPWIHRLLQQRPGSTLFVQNPLPAFLSALPKLISIQGPGSGRQGPSPLAPPEEPAND